jgi:hypothetical protein
VFATAPRPSQPPCSLQRFFNLVFDPNFPMQVDCHGSSTAFTQMSIVEPPQRDVCCNDCSTSTFRTMISQPPHQHPQDKIIINPAPHSQVLPARDLSSPPCKWSILSESDPSRIDAESPVMENLVREHFSRHPEGIQREFTEESSIIPLISIRSYTICIKHGYREIPISIYNLKSLRQALMPSN